MQVRFLFSENITNGKEAVPVSSPVARLCAPDSDRLSCMSSCPYPSTLMAAALTAPGLHQHQLCQLA